MAAPEDALLLERSAVPVCFPGMVAHWPAVQLWRGESGLQRVMQLAGEARVEAMVTGGEQAVGDMQHLVLLGTTLREFLDGTLERQLAQRQPPGAAPLRLYLAQSPVCVAAPPGTGSSGGAGSGTARMQPAALQALMEDLGAPCLIQRVQLSQANFWASLRATRSSLHYDPYSNLLCVVRGAKTVWLLPPSATPHLAPQPLTSESANHSPADLAQPDLGRFPGLEAALPKLQVFELAAGDALFIPEGWWHQVHSTDGTLAVNFWWSSEISRQMGGHMDRYYLRRLMQSLLEQQKQASLAALPRCDLLQQAAAAGVAEQQPREAEQPVAAGNPAEGEEEGGPDQQPRLSPEQAAAVGVLATALADHQMAGPGSEPPPLVAAVVATLSASSAQALLDVLLHLRRRHPQLAAHLLLQGLGPAGWELLSGAFERRQEELAAAGGGEAAEDAVSAVCDELYSVVDRQQLLDVILERKQAFAREALRAVLGTELAGCL